MSKICDICKDELGEDKIILNCNHEFHNECYEMTIKNICPYCKQKQPRKKINALLEFKKKDTSYCQAITKKGNICANYCGKKEYCGKHANYHKNIEAMKLNLQS